MPLCPPQGRCKAFSVRRISQMINNVWQGRKSLLHGAGRAVKKKNVLGSLGGASLGAPFTTCRLGTVIMRAVIRHARRVTRRPTIAPANQSSQGGANPPYDSTPAVRSTRDSLSSFEADGGPALKMMQNLTALRPNCDEQYWTIAKRLPYVKQEKP